jgi:hypothetical protein
MLNLFPRKKSVRKICQKTGSVFFARKNVKNAVYLCKRCMQKNERLCWIVEFFTAFKKLWELLFVDVWAIRLNCLVTDFFRVKSFFSFEKKAKWVTLRKINGPFPSTHPVFLFFIFWSRCVAFFKIPVRPVLTWVCPYGWSWPLCMGDLGPLGWTLIPGGNVNPRGCTLSKYRLEEWRGKQRVLTPT